MPRPDRYLADARVADAHAPVLNVEVAGLGPVRRLGRRRLLHDRRRRRRHRCRGLGRGLGRAVHGRRRRRRRRLLRIRGGRPCGRDDAECGTDDAGPCCRRSFHGGALLQRVVSESERRARQPLTTPHTARRKGERTVDLNHNQNRRGERSHTPRRDGASAHSDFGTSPMWIPHSLFSGSSHHQRPARGCSPGLIARVQGAQPIDG